MKQQAIVFNDHSDKRVTEILARAGMQHVKRGSDFLKFTPEEAARAPLGESKKENPYKPSQTSVDHILSQMGGLEHG